MSNKVQLIKEEIERQIEEGKVKCQQSKENNDHESFVAWSEHVATCGKILLFINSIQEEPASGDLEEEIDRFEDWINNFNQSDYPTSYTVRDIARHFAEWQKQKDQETIELAEDHAMLAGMNKMKEEMMKDAVDAFVNTYENTDDSNYVEFVTEQSPYKFKETEKCKLIIVKEE